ncbi:sulfotransferase family 2 domain-containing protein [Mesorhizobium sp.]|uniref:sulfotransferase family 2 domain-containing protein n=1 Tax=Mesorhizobium sp. TaxID=1871066 RepID=UPI000FEA965A|nr:sulfotransferase family 2 domain-containing protein [Mesorhizobium sp.]RWC62587.1 MAG: hypothetical protein EOS29_16175 [Mesorhizobium sp.]RWC63589.1 MAG: hypothetical protein EOS56_02690 [Mesorhizobium sp.]
MTKVNFLHVGKTGGTALIEAIREFPSSLDLQTHPHGIRLSDIPKGDKVFFVLRDPIDRFVSGFYSRQRRGLPCYNGPWTRGEEVAFSAFPTANSLAEALSSKTVERKAAAEHAMEAIDHVRTSFYDWFHNDDYFLSRINDVLFIGMVQHLNAEFEKLKLLIGMPTEAQLPQDHLRTHRNPSHVDRSLSPVGKANLHMWYKKDYLFFGLCNRIRVERGLNPIAVGDGPDSP